jgi:hypothetical protein
LFCFFAILGFELSVSSLLGMCSTAEAMPPALSAMVILVNMLCLFSSRLDYTRLLLTMAGMHHLTCHWLIWSLESECVFAAYSSTLGCQGNIKLPSTAKLIHMDPQCYKHFWTLNLLRMSYFLVFSQVYISLSWLEASPLGGVGGGGRWKQLKGAI